MIDLHSHLDLYPNALKLLPLVSARNIFTLVVTTSPRAWLATSRVFSEYENIKVALGMHPEIIEQKANERDLLLASISKVKFVGEIGLDGSQRFREQLPLQESILGDVLAECACQGGRIISLHSRGAASRVLDLLEQNPQAGKPILHWFSGSLRELHRAIELDCWFSVGPSMLAGAKGRKILSELPPNKILPETDGPFATRNSIPLMPWEGVDVVLQNLMEIHGRSEAGWRVQLKENLDCLLSSESACKQKERST